MSSKQNKKNKNKKTNKEEKKLNIEPVVIIYIAFVILSIIFIIIRNYQVFHLQKLKYNLKTMQVNSQEIDYPKFGIPLTDKIIKNLIEKDFSLVNGNVDTYINVIDYRYINMFFEINNNGKKEYKSYILDAKKNKFVDITFLVKKNKEKELNDKIVEMLNTKYPEFIVNGIINGKGKRYYKLKNNEMIIYYKDFTFTPEVNENLYVRLNYNEIKDILNVYCKFDENYQNQNIRKIDPNKPVVVFTFDDGPSPITTPQMLDVLKKNKVHATFFQLGNKMENNPDITRRAVNEGNTVGSHSYQHINLARANPETIAEQLSKSENIYRNIIGSDYKYFRVPYGSYNKTVKEIINHPIIIWNEDPRDWESRDTNKIVEMVLSHLHDGSVYVMHDIYQSTVDAIDILLPELYSRGYQVLSLDEVYNTYGKPLDNHIVYRNVK